MESAPTDPLTRRLVHLGKSISQAFQIALAEHGCTIPTWAVLNSAHQRPGLSQVQLASAIGIEGPTLARHLDRMCAEGLVERRRDELDRRVTRIELTRRGEDRWEELRSVARAHEARLTKSLSVDDTAALHAAITTIHRAMEESHVHA